jgi:hypothetical protein
MRIKLFLKNNIIDHLIHQNNIISNEIYLFACLCRIRSIQQANAAMAHAIRGVYFQLSFVQQSPLGLFL